MPRQYLVQGPKASPQKPTSPVLGPTLLVLDHLLHPYLTPSLPEGQNSRSVRNYLGDLGCGSPGTKPPCSAHKGTLNLYTELGLGKHIVAADTHTHVGSQGPRTLEASWALAAVCSSLSLCECAHQHTGEGCACQRAHVGAPCSCTTRGCSEPRPTPITKSFSGLEVSSGLVSHRQLWISQND